VTIRTYRQIVGFKPAGVGAGAVPAEARVTGGFGFRILPITDRLRIAGVSALPGLFPIDVVYTDRETGVDLGTIQVQDSSWYRLTKGFGTLRLTVQYETGQLAYAYDVDVADAPGDDVVSAPSVLCGIAQTYAGNVASMPIPTPLAVTRFQLAPDGGEASGRGEWAAGTLQTCRRGRLLWGPMPVGSQDMGTGILIGAEAVEELLLAFGNPGDVTRDLTMSVWTANYLGTVVRTMTIVPALAAGGFAWVAIGSGVTATALVNVAIPMPLPPFVSFDIPGAQASEDAILTIFGR
jgi:hypothetical protein